MRVKLLSTFSILGIFTIATLFQSCTAVPEATADYDFVLGDNYAPPIQKVSDVKVPENILLIPIPKNIPQNYYKEFVSKFVSYYKERSLILPPHWEDFKGRPSSADIQALIQDTMCDAVLFLEIEQFSAYPPLRVKTEVLLQLVKNEYVIWRGTADYDASREVVANSARRFLQDDVRRPNAPDKSLSILKNNYMFINFVANNLARKLNELTSSPPTPNPPKEAPREETSRNKGI